MSGSSMSAYDSYLYRAKHKPVQSHRLSICQPGRSADLTPDSQNHEIQVRILQGMSKIAEDSATIPEDEAVQHTGLNSELGQAEQQVQEDGFEPGAPQDYKPRMSIHAHRIEIPLDPRASMDWDTPQRAIPGVVRGAMQSHRLSISQSPGPSQLPRMAAPQASHTTVPGPMHPALARKRSARLSGQHRHSTDSDFSKENEPEEPLPESRSVEAKLEVPEAKLEVPEAKLEVPEAKLEAPMPKDLKPVAKPVADTPAVTTESAQVQERPAPAPAVEAPQPAKAVSEAVKAVNKENVQPASREPAKVKLVAVPQVAVPQVAVPEVEVPKVEPDRAASLPVPPVTPPSTESKSAAEVYLEHKGSVPSSLARRSPEEPESTEISTGAVPSDYASTSTISDPKATPPAAARLPPSRFGSSALEDVAEGEELRRRSSVGRKPSLNLRNSFKFVRRPSQELNVRDSAGSIDIRHALQNGAKAQSSEQDGPRSSLASSGGRDSTGDHPGSARGSRDLRRTSSSRRNSLTCCFSPSVQE